MTAIHAYSAAYGVDSVNQFLRTYRSALLVVRVAWAIVEGGCLIGSQFIDQWNQEMSFILYHVNPAKVKRLHNTLNSFWNHTYSRVVTSPLQD